MRDFQIKESVPSVSRGLVQSWREKSVEAGWRFPGDWLVPEVDRLLQAWSCGQCLLEPARSLGTSRAYHGVGVRETMLDVDAFYAVVGGPVYPAVMRSVVEGWVVENERVEPFSCTDVHTDLATPAHFERLVYDLSLGAEDRRGARRIVSLALDRGRDPRPLPWQMRVAIGMVFHTHFAGMDATGTVDLRTIHILIPRTHEAYFALLHFFAELEQLAAGPVGHPAVKFRAVPADRAEYNRVTADLRSWART